MYYDLNLNKRSLDSSSVRKSVKQQPALVSDTLTHKYQN